MKDANADADGPGPNVLHAGVWNAIRARVRDWLRDQAPPLAKLYEGAVEMLELHRFPGRLSFISHAVREIRNGLPDYINPRTVSVRIEYAKRLDEIVPFWQKEMVIASSAGDVPASPPDFHISRELHGLLDGLIKEHAGVERETRRQSVIRLFEACAVGSEGQRALTRPAAERWYDLCENFMRNVHDKRDNEKAEEIEDWEEVRRQFVVFETTLAALAAAFTEFYGTMGDVDKILDKANS